MQNDFYRTLAFSENGGDFLERQFFAVMQPERAISSGGKLRFCHFPKAQRWTRGFGLVRSNDIDGNRPLAAKRGDRLAAGEREQPGQQRQLGIVMVELVPSAEKRFLRQILRILPMTGER